jgi:hypothetical protein
MRVLVTGSRDWPESQRHRIANAFDYYAPGAGHTLVSGACPTGADRMAEEIAEARGWEVERHPADWDQHGKRAGFVRNSEMVRLGADFCVAFIKDASRGATMTRTLAQHAGIPVHSYEMGAV